VAETHRDPLTSANFRSSRASSPHALTNAFYFNLAEFEIAMPAPVFLPGSDWLSQNSAAWLKWSKNYCCAREWYVVG